MGEKHSGKIYQTQVRLVTHHHSLCPSPTEERIRRCIRCRVGAGAEVVGFERCGTEHFEHGGSWSMKEHFSVSFRF